MPRTPDDAIFREGTFRAPDGVELRWYEMNRTGSEDAPVLAIVNAPGATIDAWQQLATSFSTGWRVVGWEYRGLHGMPVGDDPRRLGARGHADDLLALLDQIGASRAVLLAWALGTIVALDAASRSPGRVRALVALNGVPGRPFGVNQPVRATGLRRVHEQLPMRADLVREGVQQLRRFPRLLRIAETARLLAPSIDREAFLSLASAFASLDPLRYAEVVERIAAVDHTPTLPHLGFPILLLAGRRDPMIPAAFSERMAELAPNAECSIIPIASHYLPVEFAEYIELRVEDFLVRRAGADWLPAEPPAPRKARRTAAPRAPRAPRRKRADAAAPAETEG